jgi:DICT domain-containing protein
MPGNLSGSEHREQGSGRLSQLLSEFAYAQRRTVPKDYFSKMLFSAFDKNQEDNLLAKTWEKGDEGGATRLRFVNT